MLDDQNLADRLLAGTIPQVEWTHQAHLASAHALIRRLGQAEALERVRVSIPLLNESHGVANTDHDGYHETLTVFWVAAIADAIDRGSDLAAVLALPAALPLTFWTRDRLFSVAARRSWVDPDRAPLPYPTAGTTTRSA